MDMKNYEKQDGMGYDALREIGSIGTGNAATALSAVLGRKIEMTLPEVKLVGFDKAIEELGGPEKIVVGVLTEISGEVNGIMLFLQNMEFINIVLETLLQKKINDFQEIDSLDISAMT